MFPTSKRENVKFFVTDLWEDYKGIAMTYFPRAKVVADRFHFVRYACNAVDKIRIRLQKSMQSSTRKFIKHSKKILMAVLSILMRKVLSVLVIYLTTFTMT